MLQKRISPMVLAQPKSELEIEVRAYYILYNIIILGLMITLVRINIVLSSGEYVLPLYGSITVLLVCYIALRYIISLFYLSYKIEGIFYIMSYRKVKELAKRLKDQEEVHKSEN